MPNDYTKFVSEYANNTRSGVKKGRMWICKPAESSRGRGIFIFKDISDLQYDCNAVVQQYISDPLLIGEISFHLYSYLMNLNDYYLYYRFVFIHLIISTG